LPKKASALFLFNVNNVNNQLREFDVSKAFEEDVLINKILSSLLVEFFCFNSTWDSISEAEKTLLNLSENLIKEEEKFKHAAQIVVDVTKAFYNRLFSHKQPISSSTGSHLCIGQKCPHSSHFLLTRSIIPKPPLAVNVDGTPLIPEQCQSGRNTSTTSRKPLYAILAVILAIGKVNVLI
jgi:hypothetical protein